MDCPTAHLAVFYQQITKVGTSCYGSALLQILVLCPMCLTNIWTVSDLANSSQGDLGVCASK